MFKFIAITLSAFFAVANAQAGNNTTVIAPANNYTNSTNTTDNSTAAVGSKGRLRAAANNTDFYMKNMTLKVNDLPRDQ